MRTYGLTVLAAVVGCNKTSEPPPNKKPVPFTIDQAKVSEVSFGLKEGELGVAFTLHDADDKPVTSLKYPVEVLVSLESPSPTPGSYGTRLCLGGDTVKGSELDANGHVTLAVKQFLYDKGGDCMRGLAGIGYQGAADWDLSFIEDTGVQKNAKEVKQHAESLAVSGKKFERLPELDAMIDKLGKVVAGLDAKKPLPACKAEHFGGPLKPTETIDQYTFSDAHNTGGDYCTELCHEITRYRQGPVDSDPQELLDRLHKTRHVFVYVASEIKPVTVDIAAGTYTPGYYDAQIELLELTTGKALCSLPLHVVQDDKKVSYQQKIGDITDENSARIALADEFNKKMIWEIDRTFRAAGLEAAAPRTPKPKP